MQIALQLAVVQINLHHGGATIHSLHGMVIKGVGASLRELANHAQRLAAIAAPKPKALQEFKIHKLMTQISVDGARAASEGAMLIYTHAVLDAMLHKICKISALIDEKPWLALVEQKNVKFEEVRSASVKDLEKKLLAQYFVRLERESLMFKCDTLFRILSGVKTRGVLKGFRYSRNRLLEIDQLRHDLVHKLGFHSRFRQAQAKVNYLFSTGHFFHNLLLRHYSVRTIFEIPAANEPNIRQTK